jgi:menaquinone-dependent protoporphyrinogen oxidase
MMMRVLVTAASKHGATTEIADAIGRVLADAGLDPTVLPPEQVEQVEDYDAIVLGSAIYMGRWLEPARLLVDRKAEALAEKPVWLFSCGPLGDPPKPTEESVDIEDIHKTTLARTHRIFPGRLEKRRLGFAEKAVVTALRAPEGDFRPWDEIEAWARGIADAVLEESKITAG